MKEYFAFELCDNDRIYSDGCMLYALEEKTLILVHEEFPQKFFTTRYNETIEFLIKNEVKSVTTFYPDSEMVASSPYEITKKEDYEACVEDGLWFRFQHGEIPKGSELEKSLTESGIKVKTLSPEEEISLLRKLEHSYRLY